MKINKKSLEKLRDLINEEVEYKSGPKLVHFFNELGFSDEYGQGFPSRWQYTDEKLNKINNTEKLEECIKKLFNPINFIEKIEDLDKFISDFNLYLTFDKKEIIRENERIIISDTQKIKIPKKNIVSKDSFKKNKRDEIFILEPNFYGIGIRLRSLWNLFFKKK